jgi:hypothetical protein
MPPKVRKRSRRDNFPVGKKAKSNVTTKRQGNRTKGLNEDVDSSYVSEDLGRKSKSIPQIPECVQISDGVTSKEDLVAMDDEKVVDVDPDDEDRGRVIIVMRNKTTQEREVARQARMKQLSEYNKREAEHARRERYNRRYGVTEQPSSGDEKKEEGRKVQWRRDSQLVTIHCIESTEEEDEHSGSTTELGNGSEDQSHLELVQDVTQGENGNGTETETGKGTSIQGENGNGTEGETGNGTSNRHGSGKDHKVLKNNILEGEPTDVCELKKSTKRDQRKL